MNDRGGKEGKGAVDREREREIDRLGRKMERETERVRENVRLDFVAQIDEAE